MSKYYNAKRVGNLYDPKSTKPFPISRSKLELFLECPKCFYLDRRLGVGRPPGYPFALNSAVDKLLKLEFDAHRVNGTKHPLIKKYKVDAIPIAHEMLDGWRENFVGVRYLHVPTNFEVFGAIDDLWQSSKGEYLVVDYKSTSKAGKITALDQEWQDSYKRQMEVYQWLLRRNNYKVSDTGYFVYCNGDVDKKAFDGMLEFDITLIAYRGNDDWVEKTLTRAYKCLLANEVPKEGNECDYCAYRDAAWEVQVQTS